MIDILNYFEEMEEAVYISDTMTHDLIYLNATLRKHCGYRSHEEYSGLKCYELLDGVNVPCPSCKGDEFKSKEWCSYIYMNHELGRQFLIKTRIFHYKGRQYRIGVFLDVKPPASDCNEEYYPICESIVNRYLQEATATSGTKEPIEQILAYIGTEFLCDRVYIFEFHNNFVSNTYEWCAEGIVPQKEILQNEPIESVDWWLEKFKRNEVIFVENLEKIKTEHPMTYSVLKPQNISSMAAVPICINEKICGFVGVDNPDRSTFHLIQPLLTAIEKVIPLLLKAKMVFDGMDRISFRDPLTNAYNRNAIADRFAETTGIKSLGVISFDIIGLGQINETLGYKAGDFLIQECCKYLRDLLKTDQIYRIGGDEFVSAYPDCSAATFYRRVKALKESLQTYRYHIAFGSVWSDQMPLNLDKLIAEANERRHQNKLEYYAEKRLVREENLKGYPALNELGAVPHSDLPINGMSENMESFLRAIAEDNHSSYFYFGDVQKNLYYISDNMRDDFGLKSNTVANFLYIWGQFISVGKSQKAYLQKVDDILQGECKVLDSRNLVRDAGGRAIWVRNYCVATCDEGKGRPRFISGRITHQDNSLVVDPVTNFPRASVLWEELREMDETDGVRNIIGFRFNHITEINHIYGCNYADQLLSDIAIMLFERLSDKVSFYRTEGIRCIAVARSEYAGEQEILIRQICEIITDSYHRLGLLFPHPCSVAVLDYSRSEMTIDELRNHLEFLVELAKRTPEKEYIQSSDNYPQSMKKISTMELSLNKNVLHGMENFRIVIQPAVSAENGIIKGGEVLLRWRYQDEDVSPAVFIPILEKSNMIHIVGRWVFEQTARTCSRIISCYPDFYLSFNVSLYQLNDTGFVEFMQKNLDKYHLDGSHLVAEITESCLDQQPEMLKFFIQGCKNIGLRLAMDDFGSGYSSLRMLLQYPYNIIKLDRSLLQEITVSDESQSFIRSLVRTCHYCNKQVCVEGVETEEETSIIKETECDTIQGYYHHRPMELQQLYELINRSEF